MGEDAEEFGPAWAATVRGQSQQSLDRCQDAWRHAVRGNGLQIEVTAARTMSVMTENGGHSASIKSKTACVAPPGSESDQPTENIDCTNATRPIAIDAAALGADHRANLLRVAAAESQDGKTAKPTSNRNRHYPRKILRLVSVRLRFLCGFLALAHHCACATTHLG